MKAKSNAGISLALLTTLSFLGGCASMLPPPSEKLSSLPIVNLGDTPPAGDFVLRLPAGKPVPSNVRVVGSALSQSAEQQLQIRLPKDVYIHKEWVSEDGKDWKRYDKLFSIHLKLLLPSDVHPKPADLELRIDRKDAQG